MWWKLFTETSQTVSELLQPMQMCTLSLLLISAQNKWTFSQTIMPPSKHLNTDKNWRSSRNWLVCHFILHPQWNSHQRHFILHPQWNSHQRQSHMHQEADSMTAAESAAVLVHPAWPYKNSNLFNAHGTSSSHRQCI